MGELKNCIGGEFWGVWEGLYECFKFNLCCYNILKIKNILIISLNLSLSIKIFFQKIWKIHQFPPIFLTPQIPPFQTLKQSLKKLCFTSQRYKYNMKGTWLYKVRWNYFSKKCYKLNHLNRISTTYYFYVIDDVKSSFIHGYL